MMMMISAGGTGGHIMPALSVASELRDKSNWDICWLGGDGMEVAITDKAKIPFYGINIKALRGKGFIRKLIYPIILIRAVVQSLRILLKVKPNMIFTTGGYIGVPTAVAAYILGKPIFLQEQNRVFGWASKIISLLAKRVYMGFSHAEDSVKSNKTLVCGNPSPIEKNFAKLSKDELQAEIKKRYANREGPIRVFVIGGSQGAAIFNQVIPEAMASMQDNFKLWHQAGAGNAANTAELYKKHGVKDVRVDEFIDSVVEAYEWADLVIARAGAMTLTELSLVGVASILVPFPYATDDHQMKNALAFGDAVTVVHNSKFDAKNLRILMEVWSDPGQRRNIRYSLADRAVDLHKFCRPQATATITQDILSYAT